jgi:FO synthase
VNPERPWPSLERLRSITEQAGFELRARLTVHPEYVVAGEPWIDPRVSAHVAVLADDDGLVKEGVHPTGLPWQEPDGGFAKAGRGVGRTDLHTAVDTEGRTDDRRSDFDDVYGDWDSLKSVVEEGEDSGTMAGAHLETRGSDGVETLAGARSSTTEGAAALKAAEADPGNLSDEHALTLMTAEGDLLDQVIKLADDLRRETVGDAVTYVVNRNINFTNVCYVGCRFCAFAQRRTDADAYSLSLDQVADRAEEAWDLGATEVCMQGGIDPELPGTAYFDLAAAVKTRVPQMHVHAFSPMEIVNGSSRTGLSFEDFLIKARESGLDTIPGTAAEILDDEVRWVLTKGKLPTRTWVEIVTTAHKVGMRSSSTMMYGHVDNPRHWVQHLRVLSRIQDETGGFTEFVPLPFVHHSAPIYLAGVARPGPTLRDNLAVHAMARIMLHGRIDNIQTSWVKLGIDGTRAMLQAGANDLGGTLMEETISRMAGSEHGSAKSPLELIEIGSGIGRPVVQRSTTYGDVADRA